MIRARILLTVVGLGLMLGGAAPSPGFETITVHQRFNLVACAGRCTDSDITVRSDGDVTLRLRMVGTPWQYFRYRVTPEQFAAFRRTLAGFRLIGAPPPTGNCRDPEHVEGRVAYDIRWSGGGPAGRLRACLGENIHSPWMRAYLTLGIDPGRGTRMSAAQIRDYAERIP